jgi:hypothetical protein
MYKLKRRAVQARQDHWQMISYRKRSLNASESDLLVRGKQAKNCANPTINQGDVKSPKNLLILRDKHSEFYP